MSEYDYRSRDYYSPYDREEPRRYVSWWAWLLLAGIVAIVAGGGFYLWKLQSAPVAFSRPKPPLETPVPAPKSGKPEIRHPIPDAPAEREQPLPGLGESDALAGGILAGLIGQEAFRSFIIPQQLIRRIVATVDNLPGRVVPVRMSIARPVGGQFTPSIINRARYAMHVKLFESLDPRALVQAYVKLYPLFQAAYVEMGRPDEYFNDRLVEAIDDMMAAPELATQPELVQPKVFWRYADAELESRSAGQKILMRIGGENAGRVKYQLREIRRELTDIESRKAKVASAK